MARVLPKAAADVRELPQLSRQSAIAWPNMNAPRLVLLRPRNADNLGAIARGMKNFGLHDWVVVSPNPQLLEGPGLNRLAVKAGDLLDTVKRVDTFEEAVKDCQWVVGTTMRLIEKKQRKTPRELMAQAAQRSDEKWALVFGDERNGMTNEDIEQCHALSFIPASEEQPSLNLSQAVLLYAYEYATCLRGEVTPPAAAKATDETLRQLKTSFKLALVNSQFLVNENDARGAVDEAFGTLVRARLSNNEANLWNSVFRVISKNSPK
jgi:tRNA (cytidine32/uridine32-2'-O)-methyltransferase